MKFSKWAFLGLFALLLGSAGCQTLYNPGLPQVPLMMGGDETQVGINGGSNGYGFQLAYSPYYHWVVAGNLSSFNTYLDMRYTEKYKQRQYELSTGWYTAVNQNLRLECLGGLGMGSSGVNSDLKFYRRAFLQPSAGISTRYFDFGLTSRFSGVQYYLDRTAAGESKVNELGFFWEPGLTLRAGYEQVKFNFQVGLSLAMGPTDIPRRTLMAGGGIHLTLFRDFDRFRY
jgi:hypothetical protein